MADVGAVLKWAFVSRLCILTLQVISNNLVSDHAGSMKDVLMHQHRHPSHDVVTETLLGGLDNWDSEYFIFIAQHGYNRYEQTLAFFPLYPTLMRLCSQTVLLPLSLLIPERSILLISGVLINFLVFPLAAVALYLLTSEVSKNRRLGFLASLLFCVNPASVFMSAAYTECLFALLTFAGSLAIEKEQVWPACVLFTLAGATRSNGMTLSGFIAYYHLLVLIRDVKSPCRPSRPLSGLIFGVMRTVLTAATQCLIVALPFVIFQHYGYLLYCRGEELDTTPPWCKWALPLPYSYVQAEYWGVGLFRYFQLKQLPNFMLAAPMVLLSLYCMWRYFRGSCGQGGAGGSGIGAEYIKDIARLRPYVFHLTFLLLFGVFNINVQVITRLICSSSPVVYWFAAEAVLRTLDLLKRAVSVDPNLHSITETVASIREALFRRQQQSNAAGFHSGLVTKLTLVYFFVYIVLGLLLHCNFFPWT